MPDLWEHLDAIGRDRAAGGEVGEWSIELSVLVPALRARGYHFGSVEFLVDDILRRAKKWPCDVEYDHGQKTLTFRPES